MGQNETANYCSSVNGWAVNVMEKIKLFYHVWLDVITLGHVFHVVAVICRFYASAISVAGCCQAEMLHLLIVLIQVKVVEFPIPQEENRLRIVLHLSRFWNVALSTVF